jgi:hypothetical protein
VRLAAAEGLFLDLDERAPFRIGWQEPDWLGPLGLRLDHGGAVFAGPEPPVGEPAARLVPAFTRFEGEDDFGRHRGVEIAWTGSPLPIRTTVRAYVERPLLVFRAEAQQEIGSLATGAFARPSLAWPWLRPAERAPGGLPPGTRAFGHQYTEFALPTFSDPSLARFFLLPHRPPVVEPLWLLARSGRSLLLLPLDAFHEQVIAVPPSPDAASEGVRCGWHGDLDRVPRGFATELAVLAGPGPRRVLESVAATLRVRHGTLRPSRYADEGVAKLSYWTDNGAAYWYRSEPGCDVPTTLERTAAQLRAARVPVRAFQLDSWWYPHQTLRPLNPASGMDVPPTGALLWEARPDLLPEGISDLRRRLGDPPLILHGRHFSSRSPYFREHAAWVDGDRAHPAGPELLDRLLAQAAGFGAVTYEQDWLVESFLSVRGLREEPGRARAWQEALDRAAGEHGLSLQWCMASPADFLQTLTLRNVTSIRTSGDYRYRIGSGALWAWFLYGNALARALGLHPYKDVFFSCREGEGFGVDPLAPAEALLAALSAGPVGIGDRLGRTDRSLVLRTCRADGVLVKPDVPIAALERCFHAHPHLEPEPLLGEAHSVHPAGRWQYVAGFHAWRGDAPIRYRLELADLAELRPPGPVVAYDWRSGDFERLEPDGGLDVELEPGGWDLRVLCPVLPGELTVFGDVERYATAGDRRLRGIRAVAGGVELDVLGAPGERVTLAGWSRDALAGVEAGAHGALAPLPRVPGRAGDADGFWDEPGKQRFGVSVTVPDRGWLRVSLRR